MATCKDIKLVYASEEIIFFSTIGPTYKINNLNSVAFHRLTSCTKRVFLTKSEGMQD